MARSRLKLKAIHRFTSTATAVEEITALQEQKLSKSLKKFLSEEVAGKGKSKETLAVFEAGLGAYHVLSVLQTSLPRVRLGRQGHQREARH